jgi:hypothetical protein
VLANRVNKAGGCFQVPHQAPRTVCAGRNHSRGARVADAPETGLGGAGPRWAGVGLGLAWRASSGCARAAHGLDRVIQLDTLLCKELEHCQLSPAAGSMTAEPVAHWAGVGPEYLFPGKNPRRADATAEVIQIGRGLRLDSRPARSQAPDALLGIHYATQRKYT